MAILALMYGQWMCLVLAIMRTLLTQMPRARNIHVVSIRFPNEELEAARPLLTTPIYHELKARGAQFGASYGLDQHGMHQRASQTALAGVVQLILNMSVQKQGSA